MARYYDVHPVDPQPRAIAQIVDLLRNDGLIAYPTDSGYALGIRLGNREGLERIREIRKLDDKHHFALVCKDFAGLGRGAEGVYAPQEAHRGCSDSATQSRGRAVV